MRSLNHLPFPLFCSKFITLTPRLKHRATLINLTPPPPLPISPFMHWREFRNAFQTQVQLLKPECHAIGVTFLFLIWKTTEENFCLRAVSNNIFWHTLFLKKKNE